MSSFTHHDHSACIRTAISALQDYCAEKKLNLTALRLNVFKILLEEHRAIGAYQILDRLKAGGKSAQPPVAYRALDFLVNSGFAHKIEHLNAFIACGHPGITHDPAFLICRDCQSVQESATRPALTSIADEAAFAIEDSVIEAVGLCAGCKYKDTQGSAQ